jgi:hypothetical protein
MAIRKPRVFIGSSTEGVDYAKALQAALEDIVDIEPWFDHSFQLSKSNVENLERIANSVQFALLVLTADDARKKGRDRGRVPRDNVIFELGLFMGKLGRQHTFAVTSGHRAIELPSDLSGVNLPAFSEVANTDKRDPHKRDEAYRNAVGSAVVKLRKAIASAPTFFVRPPSAEIAKVYPQRAFIAREEWRRFIRKAKKELWLYGMAEGGYARDEDTEKTLSLLPQDCTARILLLNPDSPVTHEIDADEGNEPGTLQKNILTSLARFARMRARKPGQVQIKIYDSFPQVSIVRADDQALVTNYIRPLGGDDCPTLEMRRRANKDGLFDRYVQNFREVWKAAKEWP